MDKTIDLESKLISNFQAKRKIIIVGIGNILRGDDAIGPAIIENLNGKVGAVCIDAGSAPENYIGKIIKEDPDAVLIIDAVDLGLEAGSYDLLVNSDILSSGFTTHDLSPDMFINFLKKETNADIYLLGIQPQRVSFGDEMSQRVKKRIIEISELIKEVFNA
ncbi:MAG: hydrogenase 3 maturation endopeptidase HyCI [Candidatus Omnitrophota bacterium]|nr:MAG: hydrogenase 3 maturation endopeptidase HyCI [Candidatus Omnitrophota bacterium]